MKLKESYRTLEDFHHALADDCATKAQVIVKGSRYFNGSKYTEFDEKVFHVEVLYDHEGNRIGQPLPKLFDELVRLLNAGDQHKILAHIHKMCPIRVPR